MQGGLKILKYSDEMTGQTNFMHSTCTSSHNAIVPFFLLHHEIAANPKLYHTPVVHFLGGESPAQSDYVKPLI